MILVLNTGSSSVKAAVFDTDCTPNLEARIANVGRDGGLYLDGTRQSVTTRDHADAISQILSAFAAKGLDVGRLAGVGHRVVHGGTRLTSSRLIDAETLAEISEAATLAPLHNPPAIAGIKAISMIAPDLPQIASFDTGFHTTQPDEATAYALPKALRDQGIRRYGFHGLSYEGLTESLANNRPRRLLAMHIGAGVSLCAIRDGQSVATSMGYSPLSGPVMATRTGDIDAGAVLRIAGEHGIAQTEALLNNSSGLLGLSGISDDMRTLLADPSPEAAFAVDHFCYWIARHAGSMIAAMEGVDAVAFTAGIGENSAAIRDRIMARLAWIGPVPVHIVKAEEERTIARKVRRVLDL